jgi:glycosyltransferase involved in cell wall biosynthesis
VDDIRWFAPNRYCTLPVNALRAARLRIALEGNQPAGLAVAADAQSAVTAYEYSRRHRCPLLLYLWDLPPWRLAGGRPDHVFELGSRVRRFPRLLGRYPERAGYYSRLRFVAERATGVWCPSENTVRDVQARFEIDPARVPFCYDSDRFRGVPASRPAMHDGAPVLLAVSRLVPHKNHAVILRAAARLDPRPIIHIIGQGEEFGNLRGLAAELGLTLDLSGSWVADDAVVAAYRAARMVVAPSRFEGFGLTPLEGLAMGLPVIASDIPSHREFVDGAVRFFPPDDDAALAREIAAAATQPRTDVSGLTVPTVPTVPTVLTGLTIEACAARFLPGLHQLLGKAA